jgi:hypothetical protein
MRRTLTVSVLAIALVSAACGGGGGGGGGGGSVAAYCDQLKKAAAEASQTTSTSAPSMAAMRTTFDKALDKIAAKAPSELKDDYATLKEYIDLRLQAVIDPAKVDNKRITEITPKYNTAQQAITDYNKKNCKFENTTVAPASGGTTATTAKATGTTATTAASAKK